MKTVAFVPIKLNNERVPGKNLKELGNGQKVLDFLLNTLLQVKADGQLNEIVVFCSQEEILQYLPKGITFLKRSESLDTNVTRSNDIIKAFLQAYPADFYVMCHVTSPFMKKIHIEQCIEAVQSGNYDSAFSARKIQNFLWENGQPLNFSLDHYPRTQDLIPVFEELPTPYVFTREVFEKTGGRTGSKPFICECSNIEAVDIDTPEDFEFARAVYLTGLTDFDYGVI